MYIEKKSRTFYSFYQFTSWLTLQTSDYDLTCRFDVIDDAIQKVQCQGDLIEIQAVRNPTFIKLTCKM